MSIRQATACLKKAIADVDAQEDKDRYLRLLHVIQHLDDMPDFDEITQFRLTWMRGLVCLDTASAEGHFTLRDGAARSFSRTTPPEQIAILVEQAIRYVRGRARRGTRRARRT